MGTYEPGSQSSSDTHSAGALALAFQSLELQAINLCGYSHLVYGYGYGSPKALKAGAL